jgi:hypothetical protein
VLSSSSKRFHVDVLDMRDERLALLGATDRLARLTVSFYPAMGYAA